MSPLSPMAIRFRSCLLGMAFVWPIAGTALAVDASASSAGTGTVASTPDLFEAEAQDLVRLKYIPNNSRSAQVIVTNRTRRPLTLRFPAAFAGVPVLAQMGMGGMGGMGGAGGGGVGFAGGGIGGGAQTTGGGMGQGGGMGAGGMGGMGGMGGGAFSIPPERTIVFKVATVCLEYGKPEPATRIPYKLCPVEAFSDDPQLAVVLELLGRGELPQKVAQAAAWHIANGLSWQKLGAEKIDHAGGTPDEPYFSSQELLAAHRLVAFAAQEAGRRHDARGSRHTSGGLAPAQ